MRYTILHKKQMDYRLPDLYDKICTSLAMPSGCPTNGVHLNLMRYITLYMKQSGFKLLEKYNDGCQWKMTTAVDIVSSCLVSCMDRYRG
jgi:hypothetical protein